MPDVPAGSDALLPPFPDDLVRGGTVDQVIAFLRAQPWASWTAARHLQRWSEWRGIKLTPLEYSRVRLPRRGDTR